jgi:hypothetical protein
VKPLLRQKPNCNMSAVIISSLEASRRPNQTDISTSMNQVNRVNRVKLKQFPFDT